MLKNVWIFCCIVCVVRLSHIRKAGLTSHWSCRCGVWFSCWFLQIPRCFWAWRKLLLPCWFWLRRLGLCLPVGQPCFPGRRKTPSPLWLSTNCDWCVGSCVHLHQLGLLPVDLEPCPCWCGLQESGLVLHLAVIVWQERQVISEDEVV